MRRYPPYDPPEYVAWRPDPELQRGYRERLGADPERAAQLRQLDEARLLALHGGLVRNRLHDLMLKRWVRQGVISKAWLGTGEEAVTIGAVHALNRERDVVAPMIRNAGACHEMGLPLADLFRAYLGTADGPNGGRDLHVGDPARGVIPPISHVGDMVAVMAGIALAFRQRGEARVALTWVGDGSTKTALFHEGINLAAVQRVPAVFIIQNNQVALGTRLEQHHAGDFREWPRMYGMPGGVVDGNHVLDVWAATRQAVERARSGGGPTLLIAETFRLGGHATHDEREARATFDAELFRQWGQRDPIGLFEEYLVEEGVARERLAEAEAEIAGEVEAAAQAALASRRTSMPAGPDAELPGISAGTRQPGLAYRLEHIPAGS
jgi:TPP-dependent pyruvate/acetoin dehydrogenase alpha subunit